MSEMGQAKRGPSAEARLVKTWLFSMTRVGHNRGTKNHVPDRRLPTTKRADIDRCSRIQDRILG